MSESASYTVKRKDLKDIRNTTLNLYHAGWVQPTPEEVRALIVILGESIHCEKLTGSQVAALVGLKDSRNVRKWTAPIDSSNYTKIPYAVWRLLLVYAGIVKADLNDAINTEAA